MKSILSAVSASCFLLNFVAFAALADEVQQPAPQAQTVTTQNLPAPAEDPTLKLCQCSSENCGPVKDKRDDQRGAGMNNHTSR